MTNLNFLAAFGAGVVSFFAPCFVPLLPAYIGYVTGVSANDLKVKGYAVYRKRLILSSIFYVLGFSLVFVLTGSVVASIGFTFRKYEEVIRKVGGAIILVLGLEYAGLLKLKLLAQTKQFALPAWTEKLGVFRAFMVGVIFATAWTPCVGPILGSILALAAVSQTAVTGATLLFFYSLGISLPFLLISLGIATAPKYLGFISKNVGIIARVSGIFLALLGFLLLTDTYKYLSGWLFEIAFSLGYPIK